MGVVDGVLSGAGADVGLANILVLTGIPFLQQSWPHLELHHPGQGQFESMRYSQAKSSSQL